MRSLVKIPLASAAEFSMIPPTIGAGAKLTCRTIAKIETKITNANTRFAKIPANIIKIRLKG